MEEGDEGPAQKMDERNAMDEVVGDLNLRETLDKKVPDLSGGELQRVAVAVAAMKDADIYLFDEPSSYNDVYQRLAVSRLISGDSRRASRSSSSSTTSPSSTT